jgi:hypothetical protein
MTLVGCGLAWEPEAREMVASLTESALAEIRASYPALEPDGEVWGETRTILALPLLVAVICPGFYILPRSLEIKAGIGGLENWLAWTILDEMATNNTPEVQR